MEMKLSKEQEQFIIENINDKLRKLCIPAKVHSLEYSERTGEYRFKSDDFNTVPSLFQKVFVQGCISPIEKDINKVHCIDYHAYLEYHYKEYDMCRNATHLLSTTYRSFSTDDYQSIRELSR